MENNRPGVFPKNVMPEINVVCGLQVVIKKCKNNIMCRHDIFSFLLLSCLESRYSVIHRFLSLLLAS